MKVYNSEPLNLSVETMNSTVGDIVNQSYHRHTEVFL